MSDVLLHRVDEVASLPPTPLVSQEPDQVRLVLIESEVLELLQDVFPLHFHELRVGVPDEVRRPEAVALDVLVEVLQPQQDDLVPHRRELLDPPLVLQHVLDVLPHLVVVVDAELVDEGVDVLGHVVLPLL